MESLKNQTAFGSPSRAAPRLPSVELNFIEGEAVVDALGPEVLISTGRG